MVSAHCPDGDVWTYAYDAFGRRISKACTHTKVTFIWDGDVIAREIAETRERVDVVDWFFEPGSFRPMARLEAGDLTFVINDHLGTPKEVVSGDGSLRWSADHDTWGTLRTKRGAASAPIETGDYWVEPTSIEGNTAQAYAPNPDALFCPIRFQGQWEDGETGLYYNRFRYYDSWASQYISADPLGFAAGPLLHSYASRPSIGIDPWGLQTLYRTLRLDEDPCSQGGIHPKAPHRTHITPEGHVLNGSKENFGGSNFVSTTKDVDVARGWRDRVGQNQRIVEIDGDQLIDRQIDVSRGCCLKGNTAKNMAAASAEVLIEGSIPCSAILGFVN